MAHDWLFGPKISSRYPSVREIRSLVLDLDVIADVKRLVSERTQGRSLPPVFELTPPYRTQSLPSATASQVVTEAELPALPAADLDRLLMRISVPNALELTVDFQRYGHPSVSMALETATFSDLIDDVAQAILRAGTPRPRWSRFAIAVPWVFFSGLFASWVWVIASTGPPAALVLFGWLVVVAGLAATLAAHRYITRLPPRFPGHRFRGESRAETRRRRADTRANFRVALITAPISIAATVFVTWVTGLLRLSVD